MSDTHECVQNCPNQEYFGKLSQYNTIYCERCDASCLSCSNQFDKCTGCYKGYFLYNLQCLESCPLRTYPSKDNTKCFDCSEDCLKCTDSSSCQQPIIKTPCPKESYFSFQTLICQECDFNCSSCTGKGACIACYDQYFLDDGVCVRYCPSG